MRESTGNRTDLGRRNASRASTDFHNPRDADPIPQFLGRKQWNRRAPILLHQRGRLPSIPQVADRGFTATFPGSVPAGRDARLIDVGRGPDGKWLQHDYV